LISKSPFGTRPADWIADYNCEFRSLWLAADSPCASRSSVSSLPQALPREERAIGLPEQADMAQLRGLSHRLRRRQFAGTDSSYSRLAGKLGKGPEKLESPSGFKREAAERQLAGN